MKNTTRFALNTAMAVTAMTGAANATISVTQTSGLNQIGRNVGPVVYSSAFDVQNANAVLVVGIYIENDASPLESFSFDGNAPDGVINDGRGTLLYFFNPTTEASTINFEITADTNGGGVCFWELDGADLTAPVTNSTSGSIATTVADEFVIALGWNNGGGGNAPVGDPGNVGGAGGFTSSDLTQSFEQSDGRGNAVAGATGSVASPGTVTYGWGADDSGSPVALSFKPGGDQDLAITSLVLLGNDVWEVEITGSAGRDYVLNSAPSLTFDNGTLIENLSQGEQQDPGTISGTNNSVLTLDENGTGKVRFNSNGNPRDFIRAENFVAVPAD